jgi:cytidylate kinase
LLDEAWINPVTATWTDVNLDLGGGTSVIHALPKLNGEVILMFALGKGQENNEEALSILTRRQREIMDRGDWVCDGRDIGSVVFPGAEVKVFLTASVDERARRRHAELVARGEDVDLRAIRDDVERRDLADSSRATSPLVVADGAVVVDTTGMGIDQVVARIAGMAREVTA